MEVVITETKFQSRMRRVLRWGTYPFCWAIILTFFTLGLSGVLDFEKIWGMAIALLFVILIFLETVFPFQRRWKMTLSSFIADVKYLVMNGVFLGAVSAGLALFAISISGNNVGPATQWPIWIQIVVALITFEACHYPIHRAMHEGDRKINQVLWQLHSSHHLPPKLYVLMHVVGHPLNGLLIQSVTLIFPIWFMGYDQTAVTAFLLINSMHGLLGHFNVDVRMGWFNYIFIGTELHRHHHSSDLKDAKNFGATLSIFDQIFGTFVYEPGVAPDALGAVNSKSYPDYRNVLATLIFPFKKSQYAEGSLRPDE